jgi:hypothetical protein
VAGVDTSAMLKDLPHIIDGKEVECKLAVPKDPPKEDKKRKKKKKKVANDFALSPSPTKIEQGHLRLNTPAF